MKEQFSRNILLIGEQNQALLQSKKILIAGVGGVGGMAAEMLCRAGIGNISIVDCDKVSVSNLNRQLIALNSTIGESKTGLFAKRMQDINSKVKVTVYESFLDSESIPQIIGQGFDFVIDAIDTLSPKIELIRFCYDNKIPIISSMGSAGKFDPTKVDIADISKSYNCTLARIIRKMLHRQGIYKGIPVVYSSEKTSKDAVLEVENEKNKKSVVGTISYMPNVFGCFIASYVIRKFIEVSI